VPLCPLSRNGRRGSAALYQYRPKQCLSATIFVLVLVLVLVLEIRIFVWLRQHRAAQFGVLSPRLRPGLRHRRTLPLVLFGRLTCYHTKSSENSGIELLEGVVRILNALGAC
jgi:hypothetical protein